MPKKRAVRGRRAALNKKAAATKETGNVEEKVQGSENEKEEAELSLSTEKDSLLSASKTSENAVYQNEETKDENDVETKIKNLKTKDTNEKTKDKNEKTKDENVETKDEIEETKDENVKTKDKDDEPKVGNVETKDETVATEGIENSELKDISDTEDAGKNLTSKNEDQDRDKSSSLNENDNSASHDQPSEVLVTETQVKNTTKNIVTERDFEDSLTSKDNNITDGGFTDEVEEAFIDNESDDDIQYIDEEIIEEKDQELCEVLEGQHEEDPIKNAKYRKNAQEKNNKDFAMDEDENNIKEDNNFELISEGSMDQLGQSEIIEAISDSEITLDVTDQDKGKDHYNEAAETLEEVFLATESADKFLEDKDNDYISDVSLCGDDDNGNLSLEEISDEELDSSKKKHPAPSESVQPKESDEKENENKEERESGTIEDVDVESKKRPHVEDEEDKNEIPPKKVNLGFDQTKKDNKQNDYGDAAFFTNISVSGKSKEGSKPPLLNPPSMNYVQQSALSKDLSTSCRINMSTQTQPLSRKGKIVQCNIVPISDEAYNIAEKGRKETLFTSQLIDEYKSQLPSSISEIFQEVTTNTLSEQGHYQFSLGPVTHADIDNSEFREISMKFVEKFQLSFNSKHQGTFTAQLKKQEAVAHLIRRLKSLELGTRYMIFSVAYRHGPLSSEDSIWTASIVFMYSQDRQIERQKFVSDGKERARLIVEGVPKTVSKDFIQMLFPESLYISTRLGPSLDKSLLLGYSSYLMVEETCTCYEMVLINGKKIVMSRMDPLKDITNTTQTDPGYIDENGIVLIPDLEVHMVEESIPSSEEKDASIAKTSTPIQLEEALPAQETPNDEDGLPETDLVEQKSTVDSGQNGTSEGVVEAITETVTCSESQTPPDNTLAASQDEGEKSTTTSADSSCLTDTEREDAAGEKHLDEKELSGDLPNPSEASNSESSVKNVDVLTQDKSKDEQESEKDNSETLDQPGSEEKTKEISSTASDAPESELVEDSLQAKESADVSLSESGKESEQSQLVKDTEKGTEAQDEKVEMEAADEDGSSSKMQKDETVAENDNCEKDTSLEEISDDEIINDSKVVVTSTDDDVIILQEDPSQRLVAEIDLTEDIDEPVNSSGQEAKEKKAKKKSEAPEKLSLTDGHFQVTMEAEDVEEEDEPQKVMYPRYAYSNYNKDSYHDDKQRGNSPADNPARQSPHFFRPGVRFFTRSGERYIRKTNAKDWPPRYEHYNSESQKNYEQVSSVRPGSSVAEVSSAYEGSGLNRNLKPQPSIREQSSEHYDNYRREFRRSRTPSPRRDQGFERKTSQLPQRPPDHFQHSRQGYSKDYPHGYSYASASNSNQGRGYPDWHPEPSATKRRDAYQPYEGHKSWNEGGYSKRKSPDHLPPPAYDIKKSAPNTTSSARSRVSNDRRSPNRFRRTRSRSLSPLSDKSFSSSSQSSRNRRAKANRLKASYKQISRSPISISSRSQSLSPVSKSPSPLRYSKSSSYKSRRHQYSPVDRKTSRTYSSKNRSRSRSPYWSKTKARSRSPSFKKDERSPPYKRVALSPEVHRDKPLTSSNTKSSHAIRQSQNEKSRTTSYGQDAPAGSQAKPKADEIKSAAYGNYQQQGPPQGYGYAMAPVNYNTLPPFTQWPPTSFLPPAGYMPTQTPVYSNNNPAVTAQYNYSGMPSDYTNMNAYPSYSYNVPPATVNNMNQVPQPNYNPYTTSAPQGMSQSGSASNNNTMGMSSTKKQSSQSESSSKKWSMGQSGGAMMFQRILSNVGKAKK